jgi:hypothetical protein
MLFIDMNLKTLMQILRELNYRQKREILKEFKTLNEELQYEQRTYEANFLLMITREMNNKVSELVSEIRSIINVTVVTQKQAIEEESEYVKGIYGIKFVLEGKENVNQYMQNILKKGLNDIEGVRVLGYKGLRKIKT